MRFPPTARLRWSPLFLEADTYASNRPMAWRDDLIDIEVQYCGVRQLLCLFLTTLPLPDWDSPRLRQLRAVGLSDCFSWEARNRGGWPSRNRLGKAESRADFFRHHRRSALRTYTRSLADGASLNCLSSLATRLAVSPARSDRQSSRSKSATASSSALRSTRVATAARARLPTRTTVPNKSTRTTPRHTTAKSPRAATPPPSGLRSSLFSPSRTHSRLRMLRRWHAEALRSTARCAGVVSLRAPSSALPDSEDSVRASTALAFPGTN